MLSYDIIIICIMKYVWCRLVYVKVCESLLIIDILYFGRLGYWLINWLPLANITVSGSYMESIRRQYEQPIRSQKLMDKCVRVLGIAHDQQYRSFNLLYWYSGKILIWIFKYFMTCLWFNNHYGVSFVPFDMFCLRCGDKR